MCHLDAIGAPSIMRLIHNAVELARIFPTLDLNCEEKCRATVTELVGLHKLNS